jgi:dinuclear metal center YbgI/SA1388 family protein
MVKLQILTDYCDQRLDVKNFDDYCPNGLQIESATEINTIVSGVTASLELIQGARAAKADLILVHHGYFWKGEQATLTGIKGRRVKALMNYDISLLAYHLPLDAHPELGNNRQLGLRLGFPQAAPLHTENALIWGVTLDSAISPAQLNQRIGDALQRECLHIPAGHDEIKKIAWCSGAAQGFLEQAAHLGMDAYISGEISEQTVHIAREHGIHMYAAGHHATEKYGVQALGEELAQEFGITHQFIDIPNPV